MRTAAPPWAGPKAQPAPAQSDFQHAGRGAPYAANTDSRRPKPASTSKLTAPVNFGDRPLRWMSTEVLAARGAPSQARLSRAAAGTTCAAAQPSGCIRARRVGARPSSPQLQRDRNPAHAHSAPDTAATDPPEHAPAWPWQAALPQKECSPAQRPRSAASGELESRRRRAQLARRAPMVCPNREPRGGHVPLRRGAAGGGVAGAASRNQSPPSRQRATQRRRSACWLQALDAPQTRQTAARVLPCIPTKPTASASDRGWQTAVSLNRSEATRGSLSVLP